MCYKNCCGIKWETAEGWMKWHLRCSRFSAYYRRKKWDRQTVEEAGRNLSPVSFLHCKNAACCVSVVLMQRMLDLISWVLRHCSINVLVITLLFTSHRHGFESAYVDFAFSWANRNVMTATPTWLQSALSGFGAHLLSIALQHFSTATMQLVYTSKSFIYHSYQRRPTFFITKTGILAIIIL